MLILLALVLAMSVNSCRRRLSDATQHQWRIQGGAGGGMPPVGGLKIFFASILTVSYTHLTLPTNREV